MPKSNGNFRKLILVAYLAMIGFVEAALTVLMFLGRIGEQAYLTQTSLLLATLGALLVKLDSKSEDVTATGQDVTVTEEPEKTTRKR